MAKSKLELWQLAPVTDAVAQVMQAAQTYGVRFKARELLRSLAPHNESFDAERQRLVDEFAEKDEEGKFILDADGSPQFNGNSDVVEQRWQELRTTVVTVQHKLTLEDVADLQADARLDALELLLV